jgi:hypothetical protein
VRRYYTRRTPNTSSWAAYDGDLEPDPDQGWVEVHGRRRLWLCLRDQRFSCLDLLVGAAVAASAWSVLRLVAP